MLYIAENNSKLIKIIDLSNDLNISEILWDTKLRK